MKYIQYFLSTLKRSGLARTIISEKTRISIKDYLYTDTPIKLYFENNSVLIDLNNIEGLIPVFYWDTKPNFGDFIGPYLTSKIVGKPVLNIRGLRHSGIMAVGSIIHMIDRNNMVIWGSGLIDRPTEAQIENIKKYSPEILSIRGHETAKCLSEAGINIPDKSVYGDPALILPLIYKPVISGSKKIGICPHYIHKLHFLENIMDKENLKVIDVQRDMETVVDSISSSSVCISTSLHGLIVAQAYGVPWVWLEVIDNNLGGNEFKFKDFFSTINESQASHLKVTMEEVKNLDFEMIAEKATLPDKLYDEKLIFGVFEAYVNRENMV